MTRFDLWQRLKHTFELIKFSHSIFALPFTLGAMLLAAQGLPDFAQIWRIVVATVAARTAAMAFNRWVDQKFDRENPRTASRHLPQKILTSHYVLVLCSVTSLLFILMAYQLGSLCFWLSFPTLGVLFFYSLTKRFTHLSHFFLGFALALAPIGAWIAIRNSIELPLLILAAGVLTWVAGFDILYALQDEAFDRQKGLHSMAVKLGTRHALSLARILHGVTLIALCLFGKWMILHWPYWVGIVLMIFLFFYQHSLVKPNDLSKIDAAFFTTNGIISFLFLIGVSLSIWIY